MRVVSGQYIRPVLQSVAPGLVLRRVTYKNRMRSHQETGQVSSARIAGPSGIGAECAVCRTSLTVSCCRFSAACAESLIAVARAARVGDALREHGPAPYPTDHRNVLRQQVQLHSSWRSGHRCARHVVDLRHRPLRRAQRRLPNTGDLPPPVGRLAASACVVVSITHSKGSPSTLSAQSPCIELSLPQSLLVRRLSLCS